jgi:nucleotide-binding universal stress UspA family protein
MTFRKILCPIDFSDCSRSAMLAAIELAKETGASLTLLHAWHFPAYAFAGEAPIPASLIQDVAADAERTLARWRDGARALGAERLSISLVEGVAWDRIVETLQRDPTYDLCVMGTHGRTGLKHVLLGSVAEKVVRHAPCPVLVIRPRQGGGLLEREMTVGEVSRDLTHLGSAQIHDDLAERGPLPPRGRCAGATR